MKITVPKLPVLTAKTVRWLGWGAGASVVPFIIKAFSISTLHHVTLEKVFREGDLLLVGAAVGFSALGELIGCDNKKIKPKIVWGAICGICAVIETGVYGLTHGAGNQTIGDATGVSLRLYFATMLPGMFCVYLSE